jgi:hypothetical protein
MITGQTIVVDGGFSFSSVSCILNRRDAAAICYWSRNTLYSAESAICVFFTRILTALLSVGLNSWKHCT